MIPFVHGPDGQGHVVFAVVFEDGHALAVGFGVEMLLDHPAGVLSKAGHIAFHPGNAAVLPDIVDGAVVVDEQAGVDAPGEGAAAGVHIGTLRLAGGAFQQAGVAALLFLVLGGPADAGGDIEIAVDLLDLGGIYRPETLLGAGFLVIALGQIPLVLPGAVPVKAPHHAQVFPLLQVGGTPQFDAVVVPLGVFGARGPGGTGAVIVAVLGQGNVGIPNPGVKQGLGVFGDQRTGVCKLQQHFFAVFFCIEHIHPPRFSRYGHWSRGSVCHRIPGP